MQGLMVHSSGQMVNLDELSTIPTPLGTRTHRPIPHNRLREEVLEGLEDIGLTVTSEEHALAQDGSQYFGLIGLKNGTDHDEFSLMAGIRNSHNKTLTSGMVIGSKVFVCDNLAFSGEVQFGRKHTRNILRDLPGLIRHAMGEVPALRANQTRRVEAYHGRNLNDNAARVGIFKACEAGVIASNKIMQVWNEWKEPRHDEFKPRTCWSLFNAHTEVLKKYSLESLPERTMVLHDIMDAACNLN